MKFARVLNYACLASVLVACTAPHPLPTITATISPTAVVHYFPPNTADEAQEILTQAEEAVLRKIESLEMPLSQYSYYSRAAFYAAWNAILYFPDDPRAETWKWKMAYYAAMSGESELAAEIYIEKITKALNEEKIRIEDLPAWFQSGELEEQYKTPHFEIATQPVNIPDTDYAYLIELGVRGGIDIPGSTCLLVSKQENRAIVYLVYDGFPAGGFFPTLRHPSYCTLEDLTGDGVDEIISHNWSGGHAGTVTFQVFDISALPPKNLPFNSSKDEQVSAWNGSMGEFINQKGKIQIPVSQKLGQCDIYLTRYFEWSGAWFESTNVSLELPEGWHNSLKDCYYYIPYQADRASLLNAVQILDQAVKIYSPGSDSEKDILEEFRVKKGLIYLFSGNSSQAREVFEEIVNAPLKQDGIWVTPVKNFLKTYQEPSDLYRACSALTACDPDRMKMIDDPNNPNCAIINPCQTQALDYVMSNQSLLQPLESFTSSLRTAGVEIASEGWVDLDDDGKNELWFTIYPPTHLYYDLWIVSGYPNNIQAFQAGVFPTANLKLDLKTITPNRTLISLGQPGNLLWIRDPLTNEPSLSSLYEWQDANDTTDYAALNADLKELAQLQSQLYLSIDPVSIHEKLLAIADRYDTCPYQLLAPAYLGYESRCGDYYYIIGFAAELAGDNDTAQKMYDKILDRYPIHPMAFLAQKKLAQ